MIQTTTKQLSISLWSDLKAAISEPEAEDIQKLFQDLERVVGSVQEDQRLRPPNGGLLLAGEAIAQIVGDYVQFCPSKANP